MVELMNDLKSSPMVSPFPSASNRLAEMPSSFLQNVFGKHLKSSYGFWREGVEDINLSEADMLELTAWRADIQDGMKVLDLGAGWGAFSLFLAGRFPHSQITAVTYSESQRHYIEEQARERGLANLSVSPHEIGKFDSGDKFDRVVSVELFGLIRNYAKFMEEASRLLDTGGKLFLHVLCHKKFAYVYDETDKRDWLAKHFFGGQVVPNEETLLYFDKDFQIEQRWRVPSQHMRRTCQAWLERMNTGKRELFAAFKQQYGKDAKKYWRYWRSFFIASDEIFAFKNGEEWFVTHYLFRKR